MVYPSSSNAPFDTILSTNLLSNQELDNYIGALGITALVGYEAEVNHTIGLCKDTHQDYNLLLMCSKTNIRSYRENQKHRIMYACMIGNKNWFRTLFDIANVNDILALRTKDNKTLYHLVCTNPVEIKYFRYIFFPPIALSNITARLVIMEILGSTLLPLGQKDDDGNTCFLLAIQHQAIDLANTCLYRLRDDPSLFDISNVNNNGDTPMYIAIKVNNINIVKYLHELKVDMTINSKQRQNAFFQSVSKV